MSMRLLANENFLRAMVEALMQQAMMCRGYGLMRQVAWTKKC